MNIDFKETVIEAHKTESHQNYSISFKILKEITQPRIQNKSVSLLSTSYNLWDSIIANISGALSKSKRRERQRCQQYLDPSG